MKSAKKQKGTKKKFNWDYWLASTMNEPLGYFMILLLEGYALLFAIALVYLALDAARPYSGALFLTTLVIIFQTMQLRGVRRTPGYILYLSRRAAMPSPDEDSDFSFNAFQLRGALRGMVNVGNAFSGRHFQDLLCITLMERDSSVPISLTTDQAMAAIELGIVDEASKMPNGRAHEPFADFLKKIEGALDAATLTVSDLCGFTASRYLSMSSAVKDRARIADADKRFSSGKMERLKIWAQLIGAIAALVSGATTIAFLIPQ